MREIKFRAWAYDLQQMGKVVDIKFNHDSSLYEVVIDFNSEPERYVWAKPKQIALLEYTNLKDCKGREIYEGDIVEFETEDGGGKPIMQKAEVKWVLNDTAMMIEPFTWQLGGCYPTDCEVIGNIYENKELLK